MEGLVQAFAGQLRVGEAQSYKNLTVYPLFSGRQAYLAYLTLEEALVRGAVEIGEVDTQGSVPELRLTNCSELMILILDGEELVGAKQNRIVNTTLLIPPGKTTIIPVSCVEQGRWVYTSKRFTSEDRLAASCLRAMKAEHVRHTVREFGEFRSDQGAIWDTIQDKVSRRGTLSASMAMADIYKQDKTSLEAYSRSLSPVSGQDGAVFLIGGRVAGMDCLGKPDTFKRVFRKLVESYALDALDHGDGPESSGSRESVDAFVEVVARAKVEAHPSVGLGTDLRFDSPDCVGFALAYEDQLLHLSAFPRSVHPSARHHTRMQRASLRRRHHG